MKNRIKILFDAGPLVNGQKSGVGYYTAGLVAALATNYSDEVELVGHYFNFLGLKKGLALPKAPNIRYHQTTVIPGKVFNLLRRFGFAAPFEFLAKERGNFILFPGFIGWPSIFKTPSAAAIHDLSYLEHPEYVSAQNQQDLEKLVPATITRSSFIITISEATKQKIIESYVVHPSEIVVGHIPPTSITAESTTKARQNVRKLGISKKYVLFVGNIEPRKNIVGLLNAYEQLPASVRRDYWLVLAGGKGWNDDEIVQTIARLQGNEANVVQTGYVTDEEKAALYQQASLFVLPSHYEGFGMPVLEAAAYGVPVAVSDIPVLHEVAGKAAVYFNQNSPSDMAEKIESALTDTKLREKLLSESKKNLERFSWDKTAKIIYDAIKASVGS